ncbi:hypothetical protein CDAR_489391 [Caerostris darwini]|uniref:Uncharacterized protein n=1 Tax=Caerostris darwini TaxID=1538125 RepID=A0AAV4U073_9ARAC|nr:hypothetical protein CDAR_489391 [Caerostris darwini]
MFVHQDTARKFMAEVSSKLFISSDQLTYLNFHSKLRYVKTLKENSVQLYSEWLKVWILHKEQKEFVLKFENCKY